MAVTKLWPLFPDSLSKGDKSLASETSIEYGKGDILSLTHIQYAHHMTRLVLSLLSFHQVEMAAFGKDIHINFRRCTFNDYFMSYSHVYRR